MGGAKGTSFGPRKSGSDSVKKKKARTAGEGGVFISSSEREDWMTSSISDGDEHHQISYTYDRHSAT